MARTGDLADTGRQRRPFRAAPTVAVAIMLSGAATPAAALTYNVGDAQISFETTLSAGVGIRTADPNPYFLDAAHGGTYGGAMGPSNVNWPSGTAFQAPLRGTHDLQIDLDNYTAFFRATYLFDPINSDPNSTAYQPLPHGAVTTVGHNFRLLDGFVRGKYHLFDQSQSVSVGWQTYNWGESLFLRNGLNAVNPIDAAGIHAAGADIRSLYFPVPSVDLRTSLPGGFSLEMFYEFAWAKSQLDPYGTFFSTDVSVTPGASKISLPSSISALGLGSAIPRRDDRRASDGGQFGIALRKTLESLDDGELGLYFENYGARFPAASFTTGAKILPRGVTYASTTGYRAEYPNHVQYIGASLSLGGPFGSALQGEVSYSPNTPLQVNPLGLIAATLGPALYARLSTFCNIGLQLACEKKEQLLGTTTIAENGVPGYGETILGYKRFEISHIRVSDIKTFGGIAGTPVQSWSVAVEYGMDIINNFPSPTETPLYRPLSVNALNAGDAAFFTKGVIDSFAAPSQVSEGIVGRAGFNMPALIAELIDVNPSIAMEWDFQGTTPAPLSTFDEHLFTVTAGVAFSYLQRWQAAINYTSHYGLGGSARSSVNLDRDYVALSASYRF